MRFPRLLDDLTRDLRYGVRVLTRSPLFTIVAVCSLALGIGGAASVFTVLNAVVLRELPVPNPQQLFELTRSNPQQGRSLFGWPQIEEARKELQGKAELAAFISTTTMNVRQGTGTSTGPTERAMVQLVSGEFFQVLRQQAQAGRLLGAGRQRDARGPPGRRHQRRVLGKAIPSREGRGRPHASCINGATFTIVGITQPSFYGAIVSTRNPEIWVPLMMQTEVRYASNASQQRHRGSAKALAAAARDRMAERDRPHTEPCGSRRRGRGAHRPLPTRRPHRHHSSRRRRAARGSRTCASCSSPRVTGISTFRKDLESPLRCCSAWSACCWPSHAATWPVCSSHARTHATGRWPFACRSAPVVAA